MVFSLAFRLLKVRATQGLGCGPGNELLVQLMMSWGEACLACSWIEQM